MLARPPTPASRSQQTPGPNRSRRAGPAQGERGALRCLLYSGGSTYLSRSALAPHPVLGPGSEREWEWTPPWGALRVAGGGLGK